MYFGIDLKILIKLENRGARTIHSPFIIRDAKPLFQVDS